MVSPPKRRCFGSDDQENISEEEVNLDSSEDEKVDDIPGSI